MAERKEDEHDDALSEEPDLTRDEDERPSESYPNPTQEQMDEEQHRREQQGWDETSDAPHEGEEGQDIV